MFGGLFPGPWCPGKPLTVRVMIDSGRLVYIWDLQPGGGGGD